MDQVNEWATKDYVMVLGVIFTFLLNIFQSLRSGHFNSKCGHCNGNVCCEIGLEESDEQ